jgi:hypothetical protein
VSDYTKAEALAFIEAMRLMLVKRVGFGWMVERLSTLAAYIESISDENERLNAYLEQTDARRDYEAYRASVSATPDEEPSSASGGGQGR